MMNVVAAGGLILLNGLFVAFEFALLAAMRTRLEPLAESGRFGARQAISAMGRLGPMLAGTQLGVTIASLALGSVAEAPIEAVFQHWFGRLGVPHLLVEVVAVGGALAIVVFFHLLLGEMVPKSLALAAPERTLQLLVIPVGWFVWLFRPVIAALSGMARAGTRLFGVEPTDSLSDSRTAAELSALFEESSEEGLLEHDEVELLTGALEFLERSVLDIMTPAERIVSVPRDASVEALEAAVRVSGHSRLLVVSTDGDEVVGFVHAKDVFRVPDSRRDQPLPIELRRPLVVGPDAQLGDVLVAMQAQRVHVAVIDDGDVLGLVTLEDVLESVVGQIVDETDRVATRPVPES